MLWLMRLPNKEQLTLCYRLLDQGIDCPEKDGEPLFELDAKEADRLIHKHRHLLNTPVRESVRQTASDLVEWESQIAV